MNPRHGEAVIPGSPIVIPWLSIVIHWQYAVDGVDQVLASSRKNFMAPAPSRIRTNPRRRVGSFRSTKNLGSESRLDITENKFNYKCPHAHLLSEKSFRV